MRDACTDRGGDAGRGAPAASAGGSVTWMLHREVILLAGWGRAILLQLAHPLVAQGVADHSAFSSEPRGRLRRLRRTLDAMLALTFGAEDDARRAAERINQIHDRVHGETRARHGPFAAGTHYTAHDPALLGWVHATLLDSFLLTYELFVGRLTDDERDRYCAESSRIEPLLGIPSGHLPRTHAALAAYVQGMLAGGGLVVTDTARALSREVLYPPVPRALAWIARPLIGLGRLPAIGLLPPAIRRAYDLAWDERHERALRLLAATARRTLPLLPPALRHWAAARGALARSRA